MNVLYTILQNQTTHEEFMKNAMRKILGTITFTGKVTVCNTCK
ncbi:hypothetical protein ACA758_05115 [Mycoplasmopsis agassizii]